MDSSEGAGAEGALDVEVGEGVFALRLSHRVGVWLGVGHIELRHTIVAARVAAVRRVML